MNDSELLLRQLDGHLADLRADGDPGEFALAEHLVAALRQLVTETAQASAAERARVRAAVHYLVRTPGYGRRLRARRPQPITEDVRVVNAILGR
jgi:hypothetical protein